MNVVLLLAHHVAYVLVVRAVDEKVVNVLDLDRAADRSVLVDYRRDRDDGCDVEVVVESDVAVLRIVVQVVEEVCSRHHFAASGVTADRDRVLIDETFNCTSCRLVKAEDHLHVLEEQDGSQVIADTRRIDDILVDRDDDVAV